MIDGITSTTATAANAGASATGTAATGDSAFSGLDKDAFLKLLVAQLRYQNPLSPVDGQQYLAQAAQFATVERLDNLGKAQSEAVAFQQVLLATNMVGKQVSGTPADGSDPVKGVVTAVQFKGATPSVVVDGHELPLGSIDEVSTTT